MRMVDVNPRELVVAMWIPLCRGGGFGVGG